MSVEPQLFFFFTFWRITSQQEDCNECKEKERERKRHCAMCSSYSVIPEKWSNEFLPQCHEIWCPDFKLMFRHHLFYTINQNTVRHIWQLRADNLLLYITEIISTAKSLTAKMLAKASLFSTRFRSITEELSELLGKKVWLSKPRQRKNIQRSSYPERKGSFPIARL